MQVKRNSKIYGTVRTWLIDTEAYTRRSTVGKPLEVRAG
jgi:hypothetical protein